MAIEHYLSMYARHFKNLFTFIDFYLDFWGTVVDPYTAFQEIAMFLGGMAMPLKPIPHLSDEIIAASKGFDKYSFRKDKSKP